MTIHLVKGKAEVNNESTGIPTNVNNPENVNQN